MTDHGVDAGEKVLVILFILGLAVVAGALAHLSEKWSAEAKCLALGWRGAMVTVAWTERDYCYVQVSGTDVVVPLEAATMRKTP